VPRDHRRSTCTKRDFDNIKSDADIFQMRISSEPQLRQHHNLTLLRRRNVHPGAHPAPTPAQRLHLNHAQRSVIQTENIQLATDTAPGSWTNIALKNHRSGILYKPGSNVFPGLPRSS